MKAVGLLGVAVLVAVWTLPLQVSFGMFSGHMIRHMGLVAVAAPLLVLGFPRLTAGFAISPLLAAVAEFVVVWGYHLPALRELSALYTVALFAEQGMFLMVGLFVWAGCLRAGGLAGAGGLLLTSMHMTLLGALLTLAPRSLYPLTCSAGLGDQQLGGMLMLAIGTPIYLVGGLWLVGNMLTIGQDETL